MTTIRLQYFPYLCAFALAALLLACEVEKREAAPPIAPVLVGPRASLISLTAEKVNLNAIGASASINATALDENSSALLDAKVSWLSSNEEVASIEQTGNAIKITALRPGTTVLLAESGDGTSELTVNVSQVPASMTRVNGDGQRGQVEGALDENLVVRVNDAGGSPIEGAIVRFAVSKKGGSLSEISVFTDAVGYAFTYWTLGQKTGKHEVVASMADISSTVNFSATATAGAASSIRLVSGNKQVGPAESTLTEPAVVRVTDRFGNPVEGHRITWIATSGGGSMDPAESLTDENGHANANWPIGFKGRQTALAVDSKLKRSPIGFTATATATAVEVASVSGGKR